MYSEAKEALRVPNRAGRPVVSWEKLDGFRRTDSICFVFFRVLFGL